MGFDRGYQTVTCGKIIIEKTKFFSGKILNYLIKNLKNLKFHKKNVYEGHFNQI